MSQVLLDKVRVELTSDQIIAALRQLPPGERERVRRALDSEQWRQQFEQLLSRFQARAKKHPVLEEEILKEVHVVRAERRARRLAQSSN